MDLPQIPESVKRTICSDIAMRLAASHGRCSHYPPAQVACAMRESRLPQNWDAWAMAVYCSRPDFDRFAAAADIDADYATIRSDIGRYTPAARRAPLRPASDSGGSSGLVDLTDGAWEIGEAAFDLVGWIFEGLDGL